MGECTRTFAICSEIESVVYRLVVSAIVVMSISVYISFVLFFFSLVYFLWFYYSTLCVVYCQEIRVEPVRLFVDVRSFAGLLLA